MHRRADAVGQAALLANLMEQPRGGATAEDVGEQARREIIVGAIRRRFEPKCDVGLLACDPADAHTAGEARGWPVPSTPSGQIRELALASPCYAGY